MRILVTGANGYLGKSLIRSLLEKNFIIFAIVRNSNKKHNEEFSKVNFIKLDLKNKRKLDLKLKDIEPEIIFHLSAFIPNMNEKKYYTRSYRDNLLVTRNILNYASKIKCLKKIIFSSSISIFTNINSKKKIFSENDTPKPTNHYGLHKLKAELDITYWARYNNKCAIILRFSGIHGYPRCSGVIFNFLTSAVKNNFIEVNKPNYYFSFLFLDDAINACKAALLKDIKLGTTSIYHISGSDIISLAEVAFKIKAVLGKKISINIKKTKNVNFSILCNRKAKKDLNWFPKKIDYRIKEYIKKLDIMY